MTQKIILAHYLAKDFEVIYYKSHTLTGVIFLLTYFYTLCIIEAGGNYGK